MQDLSCPVCLEIFTDPVFLSCGHSFCRTCLQQSWTESSGRVCPVCRRRSSRDHPPPDLALRNACESYKQQKRSSDSGSQGLLCSLHFEKLSLFCVDDQKLVCGQCVSQDHQSHSFCSIIKAAGPHKEKIQTCLTELEKKLQIFQKVKVFSDQAAAHIKSQAQNTERQIKEEFEKLHQFLKVEEEARITALRKEEKEKSQRMKKKTEELDSQIKDISARIAESEEKLKDDALVLQDIQTTCESSSDSGSEHCKPLPQSISRSEQCLTLYRKPSTSRQSREDEWV
ncbi:E3 ubiquitin-protein ligase TRIM39-like [Colossoma macropomum]|uniref:E3 ubiquitin-protein ligase TRIM39-like n=1 Tax=Colossoma macropomum TaxID=42526 RepID=UPI0018649589|nr:E3 ubiquitin-protein ligase TRIM39-like [Colossoma macropomum]